MASHLWNNGLSLILKPCGRADVAAKTVHTVRFPDSGRNVRIIDLASRTVLGRLSTVVPHPKRPYLIQPKRRLFPSSIPLLLPPPTKTPLGESACGVPLAAAAAAAAAARSSQPIWKPS